MKAYLVDAFTDRKFAGNRAGVILDADNLSTEEKQQLASEIYASESAFISRSDVADFKIEFFTPKQQVDFCGHNTIAAFYVLAALGKIRSSDTGSEFTEETKAGVIPVKVFKRVGDFTITMVQRLPQIQNVTSDRVAVAQALNIDLTKLDERFAIKLSNTGNWHLMIGVNSEQLLHRISYDSSRLSQVLEQTEAITAHVFYMANSKKFHVRNFCPTIGIPEDPATGSAAGAFGAYLVDQGILKEETNRFEISQGEAMGRPSTILVNISQRNKEVERVEVSGTAVISFELLTEPSLVPA